MTLHSDYKLCGLKKAELKEGEGGFHPPRPRIKSSFLTLESTHLLRSQTKARGVLSTVIYNISRILLTKILTSGLWGRSGEAFS